MPFTSKHRFIYILSHIHLSHNHLFFTHPLRKLIFGHYISSFPLSYHTPSGITQITFLNAPSKSPYKQMQSLTRNNHITSNHLPLLLFTTSKDIFIRIFSIAALFSYSNVSIAVYTRTTSLCSLASKIQGSWARSDAYEQTRRIFTLPSRKRLKEQPNQPLFLMLSISLKFECLRSASVGAKRTSTGCPAPYLWYGSP